LTLSLGLRAFGCEAVVGVFENEHIPNLEIAERARQAGLPVEIFPCRGRFDRNAVRALRKFARERGVDLVHTHGYKADIYGYAAFRRSGIPLAGTCHNWTNQSRSLRIYAHLDRFALCRFSRVIAVSETVQQKLLASGMKPERLVTIENGVDLARFEPKPSAYAIEIAKGNRKLIGMIGRLVVQKGPDLLLRAAQGAFQRFPDSAIVFIGDGPMQTELEHLAKELGIADRVIFAGSRSDVPDVCQALDMVVLPSLNEGLPMSLLEALAAKRPTIATRVGGVPRLIRNNETGLLIESGDVAGLREAMERLLADPALAARLARAGRTLVEEQFSSQAMARKYLNVFEELAPVRASANQRTAAPGRPNGNPAQRSSDLSFDANPVKVSIIIPARNEEQVLAQCLDSLTRMKYPRDFPEVI
ncbi:MAG: glycosyltransferase, partial [Candidatus Acidiferrales bacterium]